MRLLLSLDELHAQYDVAIVGAGPAGMAAAITTSDAGLRVLVLEALPAMGGRGDHAWRDVRAGIDAYRATECDHLGGARVTGLGEAPAGEGAAGPILVTVQTEDGQRQIELQRLVIATGAVERPMPVTGWTLPGVAMLADAGRLLDEAARAQAVRKQVILAGCGPLLWHLAGRMMEAGQPPELVIDTSPGHIWREALRAPLAVLQSPDLRGELAMQLRVRRKVRVVRPQGGLEIDAEDAKKRVTWWRGGGAAGTATADLVVLHQGLVPDLALARLAGCRLSWNAARACWQPDLDVWGRSGVPGVLVAGDAAGIAGFETAIARGHLAGFAAAHDLGAIDIGQRVHGSTPHLKVMRRFASGRAIQDALARPSPEFRERDPAAKSELETLPRRTH